MTQTWSRESTDNPMVEPMSQWFGNGFGQNGSTSNMGACRACACATPGFSSTASPIPSATKRARQIAPTTRCCFRFMVSSRVSSQVLTDPMTASLAVSVVASVPVR